ncbi:hypothetical protein Tco_0676646, partial [Tanacetum coccineum]
SLRWNKDKDQESSRIIHSDLVPLGDRVWWMKEWLLFKRKMQRTKERLVLMIHKCVPEIVSTASVFDDEDVTMAMAQTLIKMKEEKAKEKGVVIKDETEYVEKTKKKVQGDAQMERDAEVALRLQEELDEELRVERERQEEASKVAITGMFDEVQARIDADYELAARMTHEE